MKHPVLIAAAVTAAICWPVGYHLGHKREARKSGHACQTCWPGSWRGRRA